MLKSAKTAQLVADDIPKPKTIFGAWKEIRETYQKQLEHPTHEFDTQVSASRKDSSRCEEQLEATLGIETLEMVH